MRGAGLVDGAVESGLRTVASDPSPAKRRCHVTQWAREAIDRGFRHPWNRPLDRRAAQGG